MGAVANCEPSPVPATVPTPAAAAPLEAVREHFRPVWKHRGCGWMASRCAWCGAFVVSTYGVTFPDPHEDGCGYLAICALLGMPS